MNGVDRIIDRIKKESEAKVKEIMDNASNEAENIRKRNEKTRVKMQMYKVPRGKRKLPSFAKNFGGQGNPKFKTF